MSLTNGKSWKGALSLPFSNDKKSFEKTLPSAVWTILGNLPYEQHSVIN